MHHCDNMNRFLIVPLPIHSIFRRIKNLLFYPEQPNGGYCSTHKSIGYGTNGRNKIISNNTQ
uniref:Uncharacterized protein n=1 Tax=Wuchereria bancrofti TaxID=6293 RepID=A0A1I8EW75_WUCBA